MSVYAMLGPIRCLGGSVLLSTMEYFVKSLTQFHIDSLTTQISVVFSPREREHFNRFVSSSLLTR